MREKEKEVPETRQSDRHKGSRQVRHTKVKKGKLPRAKSRLREMG